MGTSCVSASDQGLCENTSLFRFRGPLTPPEATTFMYEVGIVKAVPTTWKELFFSEIEGVGGS